MACDELGLALPLAARQREYSPSSCIGGNYQPFVRAYSERSAAARDESCALGARWGELRYGNEPAQRIELSLPREAPRALLVFIHGGYWQELSAGDSLFAAARCAERGIAFAAIDYTLAPAARVGAIVAECRAALALLRTRFANLPIVVAGSSAGAHLAAMCALPIRGAPSLQGAVLVSGIFELAPLAGTSIDAALQLSADELEHMSPARQSLRGFPPAIVCWGEVETRAFKAQSRAFADRLHNAGTQCVEFEVPGRNHFDVILDLAEPGTVLGQHTIALLESAATNPTHDPT
jgi:arylformamidase